MKLSPRSLALLIVIVHHAVAGLHGVAHGVLGIALTPFQGVFVAGVIIALPTIAVVLLITRHAGWGALLLVVSMLASLAFGIVYHVLLSGADNMFEVGQGTWAILFQTTGPALSTLEALGALAGIRLLMPVESPAKN
ncbi:MAG: hypothetical protein E6K17_03805 [Methanobacteriota archaeon]|nr:MAG: hypothetical protein E6K17_03805 [Euryarchaeota archaeon]